MPCPHCGGTDHLTRRSSRCQFHTPTRAEQRQVPIPIAFPYDGGTRTANVNWQTSTIKTLMKYRPDMNGLLIPIQPTVLNPPIPANPNGVDPYSG